jgi:hypothetical protein
MKELDQFTVERLKEITINALVSMDEASSLARIALSVKINAEPHKRMEVWGGGNTWIQCSKQAYDRAEAEGERVRILYERPELNSPEIPDGWVMVPKPPTQKMVIHGFESDAMDALADAANEAKGWPYSCRESAELVTGIFNAMVAVTPKPEK